jgi:hypothetical protein
MELTPPTPLRIGAQRPWFPPRDFALLTESFISDGVWRALLRGIHYERGYALMRKYLRRWAASHSMTVEIVGIPDLLALAAIDRTGELRKALLDAGCAPPLRDPIGILVRFIEAAS